MRAISPNRQTGVATHVFSRSEELCGAGSPPKSTLGSTSPLEFGQDLVKVSEPVRTGDLRLGNSEGQDSRTSTALHSEPKPSNSLGTISEFDPRISHPALQKPESLGPTGVQGALLSVNAVACQLGVCNATVYALCTRGELPHVRIMNAIRVAPVDLAVFLSSRRGGTYCT